ncbi:MAG: exodeoxyribonuclease III [Candidatus Anaerobiospirillum merdipullorum]|uniref:Exodeoxyribonuclease III n=1 Tax=Candidatus Anaerobiospirillum merdipullorum TaxID=2838450 RepID=A0A9E2KPF0_9GAMM|nr:exodeoxyribonuclease III [Candidatus Anaerobiospirillum merdipullorum]
MQIKLASWNVNGIRAVAKKPDWQWFLHNDYDVIGLQETKASLEQLSKEHVERPGCEAYFSSSVVKKGYSGTAVFSRIHPLAVELELPDPAYQGEGRIVHLEFEHFHFFNGYFPNGGAAVTDEAGNEIPGQFKRVPYKMGFFDSFFNYVQELRKQKPIVVCGDFNIAHQPIDLARPKSNVKNTGFLPEERAFLDKFTAAGYIDTFRLLHPDEPGHYTWWSYKTRAREKNVGWRIDYFFVSAELKSHIVDAVIEKEVFGSDHCPIGLTLEFN